jgi:micrococcal nuclease
MTRLLAALAVLVNIGGAPVAAAARIGHVTDGDTVVLADGARVRLVQIDTPEVYFGVECFGRAASAALERMLPPGTETSSAYATG